eukprot:g28952.t1
MDTSISALVDALAVDGKPKDKGCANDFVTAKPLLGFITTGKSVLLVSASFLARGKVLVIVVSTCLVYLAILLVLIVWIRFARRDWRRLPCLPWPVSYLKCIAYATGIWCAIIPLFEVSQIVLLVGVALVFVFGLACSRCSHRSQGPLATGVRVLPSKDSVLLTGFADSSQPVDEPTIELKQIAEPSPAIVEAASTASTQSMPTIPTGEGQSVQLPVNSAPTQTTSPATNLPTKAGQQTAGELKSNTLMAILAKYEVERDVWVWLTEHHPVPFQTGFTVLS